MTDKTRECSTCGGSGELILSHYSEEHGYIENVVTCPTCGGSGEIDD